MEHTDDLERTAAVAVAAAKEAGEALMQSFRGEIREMSSKGLPADLVSAADRGAEEIIRKHIGMAFPNDGIWGEEEGEDLGTSGRRWIVDPLDGTYNYLRGMPNWCVSIACEDEAGLAVGVVLDPAGNEIFSAMRGGGISHNGAPLVQGVYADTLRAAAVVRVIGRDSERLGPLTEASRHIGQLRNFGSGALALAWTAAGRIDATYYEATVNYYDVAAGLLLCQEAGIESHWYQAGDGCNLPRVMAAPAHIMRELDEILDAN